MEISLKDLLEAGCHFGHQVSRWNPKMKPYIFTARDNVHIFDLVKTKEGLERAALFIGTVVKNKGKIIFIGTKKQAKEIIKEVATKTGMPYVTERWVGGTITNWEEIKKNLQRLKELKSKKETGEFKNYTKKENLLIEREILKLEKIYGGISCLEDLPQAIFVVDVKKEWGAVKEAWSRGIKIVGIVDTNADPTLIDYVIPANDDAPKSIELILNYIGEVINKAKQEEKVEKKEAESKKTKIKKEEKRKRKEK